MATISSPIEQRIVLDAIPWEMYERLLAAQRNRSAPRFTYDRGQLEIMRPSSEHEELKHMVELFVEVLAEEGNLSLRGFGSTTFRREDLARGFEPDGCFYVQSAARIRGKKEIDLTVDPPPDLVIEIDLTSPSLAKFPIFAQLGIPEVWQYNGRHWQIFGLTGNGYSPQADSVAFPGLTAESMTYMLEESLRLERPLWLRQVRAWARGQQPHVT